MATRTDKLLNISNEISKHDVFLTGVSGFVGSFVLYKWLKESRQDSGKTMYVLLRKNKKYADIQRRLREGVLGNRLFTNEFDEKRLNDFVQKGRIIPVEGDLRAPLLGVKSDIIDRIKEKRPLMIHCAADVMFNRHLNEAMGVNVHGSVNAVYLTAKMNGLAFVHVSTLYVNSRAERSMDIDPKIYENGIDSVGLYQKWLDHDKKLSEKEISRIMSQKPMKKDGSGQADTETWTDEWPNTYTFTKNVTEHVVRQKCVDHSLPLAICRLGIVSPSFREDKGWFLGQGGFVLAGVGAVTNNLKYLKGDGQGRPELVPIDHTVNAMWGICAKLINDIEKAPSKEKLSEYGQERVYQIGIASNEEESWCMDDVFQYNKPRFRAKAGIVPGAHPNCGVTFVPNPFIYRCIELLIFDIPLFFAHPLSWLLNQLNFIFTLMNTRWNLKMLKKIKFLQKARLKMVLFENTYAYFLAKRWNFDHENVQSIFENMDESSQIKFNFDDRQIGINHYSFVATEAVMLDWYAARQKRIRERERLAHQNDSNESVNVLKKTDRQSQSGMIREVIDRLGVAFGGAFFANKDATIPWVVSFVLTAILMAGIYFGIR